MCTRSVSFFDGPSVGDVMLILAWVRDIDARFDRGLVYEKRYPEFEIRRKDGPAVKESRAGCVPESWRPESDFDQVFLLRCPVDVD